jgi:hypothetical protein
VGWYATGIIPHGDSLVSKWHGTDHPICVAQMKSEPVITTPMSIAVAGIHLTNMVEIISYTGIVNKMSDPVEELHAVFAVCGINKEATRATIIAQEGFTQLGGIGVLEMDTGVSKIAKRMAMYTQGEGRVLLGTIIV